jgi:hypothetical protein
MQSFVKIEMDVDEFCIIMQNLDAWERFMNMKFVEADITGNKVIIKAMPVASTGFFIWVQGKEVRLMAELVTDSRVGYIDLEELAEFDKELLEQLKNSVVLLDNDGKLDGRYFPKSQKSIELFNMLMKTAKWRKFN